MNDATYLPGQDKTFPPAVRVQIVTTDLNVLRPQLVDMIEAQMQDNRLAQMSYTEVEPGVLLTFNPVKL